MFTNKTVSIRQLFSHIAILLSNEISVAFNISSSHVNTNLSIILFSHEQFLASIYSLILHTLLY